MRNGSYYLDRKSTLSMLKHEAICIDEVEPVDKEVLEQLEKEGLVTTSHAFGWTYYILTEKNNEKARTI